MSTTRVGTRAAPANPARPWAASITSAVGLSTMVIIATRKRATAVWKKIFEPKRWPSLAPNMMNPETPSEYSTIAVPTVVGGVLKLSTIPPIDTGMAATLKDINIWPIAMTIMGTHEARTSASGVVVGTVSVAMVVRSPALIVGKRFSFACRGSRQTSVGMAPEVWRLPLHPTAKHPNSFGETARAKSGPALSILRLGDEQVHAQPLRQKPGHELPLDAV